MSNYVIISDSACDLTAPLRQRFGLDDCLLGVVSFPDGHEELSDLDWERMKPKEFYDSMSGRNILYKTSTFVYEDGVKTFEKYLKEGKDILSISISSALSGTYQLCCLIAKELGEKYPDRKIVCVDSLRYSTSLALLVMLACKKRDEGASLEENAAWINGMRHCIHQMGPMDDLFFLVKTGRISNFKALFGSLVGINPMADFNREGLSEVIVKFKGKKSAFDATVKYVKELAVDPEKQVFFVAHSNREAAANTLAEMIKKEIGPKEIIINDVGMSCGASIGPGLVAAFFIGPEVSEGLVNEKAIMDKISGKDK